MTADAPPPEDAPEAGEDSSEKRDSLVVAGVRQPGVDCWRCKGMMFNHPGCFRRPEQAW